MITNEQYKYKVFYSYMNFGEYYKRYTETNLVLLYDENPDVNSSLASLAELLELLYVTTSYKYVSNTKIKELFERCGIAFSEANLKIDSSVEPSASFNKLTENIPVTVDNIEFLQDIENVTYKTPKGYNVSAKDVKNGNELYLIIDSYDKSKNNITYKYSTNASNKGIYVDSIRFNKDIRNNPFFSAIFTHPGSLKTFEITYETDTIEITNKDSEDVRNLNYQTYRNILELKNLDKTLRIVIENIMNELDKNNRKKLEEKDDEDLVISTYLLDEHEDTLNQYKNAQRDSQRLPSQNPSNQI